MCEGDLSLLVTVAANTGASELLAKASLLLLLVLGVNRVFRGVVRREGLLLGGAGEGDLKDRCLGSCLGGDDSVLAPGVLDLLGGWAKEVLDRADLSLGVVEEIGWVGGVEKAGLAMVLPVMLGGVMLVVVEPSTDV
jgi:hypothetical protein